MRIQKKLNPTTAKGWVREWCRNGRGGSVVVLGHEGGSSTRAEGSEVERVDKMWRTPGCA